MAKTYTDATQESIKRVLENAEKNKMTAVGLNVSLVRAMVDEIERQQKLIDHLTNNISIIMQPNPESEPE